jgi:S1-C subfamily serine protease
MLADANGHVIGINSMVWRGLGLAAPSNEVAAFSSGEEPLRLGVEIVPVELGLLVAGIAPDSLAERSGVLVGDIILCAPDQLRRLLRGAARTGAAEIAIQRGGVRRTLRVAVETKAGARAA